MDDDDGIVLQEGQYGSFCDARSVVQPDEQLDLVVRVSRTISRGGRGQAESAKTVLRE
jgi:hypothetical protein